MKCDMVPNLGTCPEPFWPMAVQLTLNLSQPSHPSCPCLPPFTCAAKHSLSFHSSPPVHADASAEDPLPPLFPWAFSLTTQVPVQVSLFLGLPEHGSFPPFTTFVCWFSVSHLHPTTKMPMLRERLLSGTVGICSTFARACRIVLFSFC